MNCKNDCVPGEIVQNNVLTATNCCLFAFCLLICISPFEWIVASSCKEHTSKFWVLDGDSCKSACQSYWRFESPKLRATAVNLPNSETLLVSGKLMSYFRILNKRNPLRGRSHQILFILMMLYRLLVVYLQFIFVANIKRSQSRLETGFRLGKGLQFEQGFQFGETFD